MNRIEPIVDALKTYLETNTRGEYSIENFNNYLRAHGLPNLPAGDVTRVLQKRFKRYNQSDKDSIKRLMQQIMTARKGQQRPFIKQYLQQNQEFLRHVLDQGTGTRERFLDPSRNARLVTHLKKYIQTAPIRSLSLKTFNQFLKREGEKQTHKQIIKRYIPLRRPSTSMQGGGAASSPRQQQRSRSRSSSSSQGQGY